MTTFDEREKAFEKKFEHDQDLQFRVNARRNKLLAVSSAAIIAGLLASVSALGWGLVQSEARRVETHLGSPLC